MKYNYTSCPIELYLSVSLQKKLQELTYQTCLSSILLKKTNWSVIIVACEKEELANQRLWEMRTKINK